MLPHGTNAADRHFFMHLIPNYAFALKNHLRRIKRLEEFTETEHLFGHDDHHVKHTPNRIARLLFEKVNELNKRGVITNEQFLTLSAEVQQFTEICGGCERIKNTPIPFSYSGFIKKFMFFYIMTLPLGYVFAVGYLIIPIVVFIFYVLASLELIAEEIEDPFGFDANDLPTDTIAAGIRETVFEIME
jgi:putative membrane protein